MNDLRKAAEMALGGLETLWDILDDIDTASDMAKENDAWYRKRVEALQKKRWDTMITTDGYKLKGGPVEALRQALNVDTVNMSQERVDETAKREHVIDCTDEQLIEEVRRRGFVIRDAQIGRELVGLTEADIYESIGIEDEFEFAKAIEAKLKEKNCG